MVTRLANGVTVVTEPMDHLRSVSCGVWVKGGSAADPEKYAGMAHFCEHMAFKSTENYSAGELAEQFDAMGGYVNAYTAKLLTCYYCTMLDKHVTRGLELLADMVLHPAYLDEELETERRVILEEIAMCEDSPEDLVMARLSEGVWRDSVLGREILGKAETVKRITAESMREYQQTNYVGANIVISASGHLDEQAFLADCERLFGQVAKGVAVEDSENGAYACVCALTEKDIEQNHLCIGFPSYPMFDERRYAVSVLSALTGGTMSSRLFRSIREQEGLAYNISSYLSPYLHTGLFCIYTALAPASESKCLTRIRQELDDIRQNGFTDAEVARAKEQLASGMILDLESSSAHMKMRAKREIYGMGETDADEILRRIDGVTAEQVRDVAQEILDYVNMSISVVGHTQDEDFYRSFFS